MTTYDLDAELAAVQFVISILIKSHHDKTKLLSTFDQTLLEFQSMAVGLDKPGMSSEIRESIAKYRLQIESEI